LNEHWEGVAEGDCLILAEMMWAVSYRLKLVLEKRPTSFCSMVRIEHLLAERQKF
jgi:hypothetical protein